MTHTLREIVDQGWRVCDVDPAQRPAEQATFDTMIANWRCDAMAATSTEEALLDATLRDLGELTGDPSLVPPREEFPPRRTADGTLLAPLDVREYVGRIFYDHPVQVT